MGQDGLVWTVQSDDHRWDGVLIGGLALAAAGAFVGHGLCQNSDTVDKHCTGAAVGGALVGGTIGVVVGGLIGSLIPRGSQEASGSPLPLR